MRNIQLQAMKMLVCNFLVIPRTFMKINEANNNLTEQTNTVGIEM